MKPIKKTLLFALLLGILPITQSCDKDKDNGPNYIIRIATVKTLESNQYYLLLDDNKTIWLSSSLIPGYVPKDGQRVLADYTLLDETNADYTYVAQINNIHNVLTKSIEQLTSENKVDFGNSPINIPGGGIWVGSNYLNIEFFMYVPISKRHKISLVQNTLVTPAVDGYLHLELRYNTYNDISPYVNRGIVSFDLGVNGPSSQYKGIKLIINSAINGTRELLFNYSDQGSVSLSSDLKDVSLHVN